MQQAFEGWYVLFQVALFLMSDIVKIHPIFADLCAASPNPRSVYSVLCSAHDRLSHCALRYPTESVSPNRLINRVCCFALCFSPANAVQVLQRILAPVQFEADQIVCK